MTAEPTDLTELTYRIRHAHRRATDSEWCLEENCRYRHWTSGSVPTHRRGSTCPPMPTLEAAVLPIVAEEVRKAKAEALREAASAVDLDKVAEEWSQGPGNRNDMHWAAGNAASSVVATLHDLATEHETGDQR